MQLDMERNLSPNKEIVEEEDYINMDIISSTSFLCCTVSSPPHAKEFEFQFQMSSYPPPGEAITSPADELFYQGKLLPLHFLPRLQVVQKLLANSTAVPCSEDGINLFDENMGFTSMVKDTAITPLFESSTVFPATSCYACGELNTEEYCYKCSMTLVHSNTKKSSFKKFNFIRESSLSHRLKASRDYFKSLFTNKSRCSAEPSAVLKDKERSSSFRKLEKRDLLSHQVAETNTIAAMRIISPVKVIGDEYSHRSTFSGIIRSRIKSPSISSRCSTSSSSSSNGLGVPQGPRRSSSMDSDEESSIQGAIAHCKMSQQLVGIVKSASDVGLYSSTASRIIAARQNQEGPRLCRG